jgi:hypothetical protein|nr:MAG TPA: hypothetical protein [Caudoviricetes sp.]
MFGEKEYEYSLKSRQEIPVIQSAKYRASREKALKTLEDRKYLKESDFWILMNETKTGKMMYTGLIISHNACLKINDNLPEKDKFNPDCVSVDKSGYGNSLVFTYANNEQGLYEVGEASAQNCKNAYPYAMAYKRLFDRVVLKICKLAFDGIYSDSEADEFKERYEEEPQPVTAAPEVTAQVVKDMATTALAGYAQRTGKDKKTVQTEAKTFIGKLFKDFTDDDWRSVAKEFEHRK